MVNLNVVGGVLLVLSVAIWGAMYVQSGASTLSNTILILGGMAAGTCFSLAWAEEYTS